MTAAMSKVKKKEKVRLGAKVRRLRREKRLSQAQLADQLGISSSYLNLIEHNHRNVTVDLLLKLADLFDLNIGDMAEDDEGQLLADLMEAFDDALFEETDLTNTDVRELVRAAPSAARAMLKLYDAFRNSQTDIRSLATQVSEEAEVLLEYESRLPADQISDFIQESGNYFADIEQEAERIRAEAGLDRSDPVIGMTAYLEQTFGVRVAVLPPMPGMGSLRRYDPNTRRLEISEMLPRSSRLFQISHQIGLLAASPVFDTLLLEGGLRTPDVRSLGRIALANYFASALMMPYGPFHQTAKALRYDIELLQHHFDASFEQVCHRLTTLQRPGAKGVPMHMMRVDIAGNISKRFTASGLRIPRHGGACPRWNVYTAFLSPGVINGQVSRMADGNAYFCIARTIQKGGGGYGVPQRVLSIGLGCDLAHARELVYSDGIDLETADGAIPVGVQCRSCDRMDCRQRAFPPVHHKLAIDENARGLSAYVTAAQR
jgi:predicted transcriptional regulator/DNA-binding XRE family transcriptional regulator